MSHFLFEGLFFFFTPPFHIRLFCCNSFLRMISSVLLVFGKEYLHVSLFILSILTWTESIFLNKIFMFLSLTDRIGQVKISLIVKIFSTWSPYLILSEPHYYLSCIFRQKEFRGTPVLIETIKDSFVLTYYVVGVSLNCEKDFGLFLILLQSFLLCV